MYIYMILYIDILYCLHVCIYIYMILPTKVVVRGILSEYHGDRGKLYPHCPMGMMLSAACKRDTHTELDLVKHEGTTSPKSTKTKLMFEGYLR